MILDTVELLAGLLLIIQGGRWFVAAAVRVAEFLNMPRVVIGSTLVSLTTTAPEMVVSVMAGLRGESSLAVGNAVGSCLCNTGLILGASAALKPVAIHPRVLRTPLIALFAGAALLAVLTLDLRLSRAQGAGLLALGLGYFVWDFWQHYRDRKPEDLAEAEAIEAERSASGRAWWQTRIGTAVQFALGALLVLVGSRLLVHGAVGVAGALGVPPMFIGLTVVAVGTSLPELVTAIASTRQAVSDLAVGNVLGANIANLTLIVGLAAVVREVTLERRMQAFNFSALLLMLGLLLWVLLSGRRVTRREGATLLAAYGVYLVLLVVLTAGWPG